MSNDLIDFLDAQPDPEEGRKDRRVKVSRPDIEDRCDYYESCMPEFKVTQEHKDILYAILHDISNVFITGGAGTGKTSFIRDILIPELDNRGLMYGVTATTGLAGSHLGGRTIHSWSGIRLGPEWSPAAPCPQDMTVEERTRVYERTYEKWLDEINRKPAIRDGLQRRVRNTEVLILDEASMAGGSALVGYLNYFFKMVRDDERPFGGLQMIFVGDFCQLPPVERRTARSHPDWAFLCDAWQEAAVKPMELTKIFRQEDKVFADFLNAVRVGDRVDPDYVNSFVRQLTTEETKNYSFLVPTNLEADDLNDRALEHFTGPTEFLPANFHVEPHLLSKWDKPDKVKKQLLSVRVIKEVLPLRVGCPVLFTVNHPSGEYFNGTRGFVRSINVGENRKEISDFRKLMSNAVEEDTIEVWIPMEDHDDGGIVVNIARYKYSRNEREDPDEMVTAVDPKTGDPVSVHRYPVLEQFPLIPATAITIHKSQGMSLDACVLHLRQTFAAGHVYVGLSRLRTAEGLVITDSNFHVKVDQYVMSYYRQLRAASTAVNED